MFQPKPVTNTSTVITEAAVEAAMENTKESVKTSDIPATPNSTPVLRAAEPTGSEVFERHVEKAANKVEIAPVMVSASDDIVKKPNKKKNKNKKANTGTIMLPNVFSDVYVILKAPSGLL